MPYECTCNTEAQRGPDFHTGPGGADLPSPGLYWVKAWRQDHCMHHGWYGWLKENVWCLIQVSPDSKNYVDRVGSDAGVHWSEVWFVGPKIELPTQ